MKIGTLVLVAPWNMATKQIGIIGQMPPIRRGRTANVPFSDKSLTM